MINHRHRFRGRSSIQRHYKRAESVRVGSLSLRYAATNRPDGYRAAVVVSKKVSKSAVVRNRIRRRVYENVRILSTPFTANFDIVVVIYDKKAATMPAAMLTADLTKAFVKAGILPQGHPSRAIVEARKNT